MLPLLPPPDPFDSYRRNSKQYCAAKLLWARFRVERGCIKKGDKIQYIILALEFRQSDENSIILGRGKCDAMERPWYLESVDLYLNLSFTTNSLHDLELVT